MNCSVKGILETEEDFFFLGGGAQVITFVCMWMLKLHLLDT